jgi:hypothetical protein
MNGTSWWQAHVRNVHRVGRWALETRFGRDGRKLCKHADHVSFQDKSTRSLRFSYPHDVTLTVCLVGILYA